MAKFLSTRGLSAQLEEVIKSASSEIYLVTPFLKMSDTYHERLREAIQRGVAVTVIYGKKQLDLEEEDKIMRLASNLYFKENLHAKCFANEKMAIIGSMNLYAYSEINNRKMGVLLTREEDEVAYMDCMEEVRSIMASSRQEKGASGNRGRSSSFGSMEGHQPGQPGFCIRTGEPIPFNPDRPLSPAAYRVWSQYGDPFYPEQFCHFSGESSNGETCVARPILRENWEAARIYARKHLRIEL